MALYRGSCMYSYRVPTSVGLRAYSPPTDAIDTLVVVIKEASSNSQDDDQIEHGGQEVEG